MTTKNLNPIPGFSPNLYAKKIGLKPLEIITLFLPQAKAVWQFI
jgi:hypothetical protein